jgi:hypothetical protein
LAQAQSAATDWYVKVKIHNNTDWTLYPYQRILAAAGTIEEEPQSVSKKSEGSGGKYDAPFGPYGVSALISYSSPDPNWKFAWCFVMPYIGSNSCHARIVSKDTNIDQKLFNSMDGSTDTATSQSNMTVDGKKYTFTARLLYCTSNFKILTAYTCRSPAPLAEVLLQPQTST